MYAISFPRGLLDRWWGRTVPADMPDHKRDVERYRNRAEEVRIVAQTMQGSEPRKILLAVAADCEHMADQLERLDGDATTARKSK